MLSDKIANGGSGVWGAMPMPASPRISEADRKILVRFVLSLRSASSGAAKSDGARLNKNDARKILTEEISSTSETPAMKQFAVCMLDVVLNEAYSDASTLDLAELKIRIHNAMERINPSMKNNDPGATLEILSCALKSVPPSAY